MNLSANVHIVNIGHRMTTAPSSRAARPSARRKKPEDAYHHGDLKNALVEEAARLVEREGLASFSLREVARRLGVSPNAAYRHFADKDALLTAVAGLALQRLSRTMQQAIDAVVTRGARPRAVAHLVATGRAYVEFAIAHPELFRVAFGATQAPPGPDQHCAGDEPDPFHVLSGTLDELVRVGALAPERRIGAELKAWTTVHGYASLALGGGPLASLEPLDAVLAFVVDGIGASAR